MKLYYSPGSCSLSVHIALREAGAQFDLNKVDGRAKKTEDGVDYYEINPKGYVPALVLNDGQTLTECAAILQYVADQHSASKLAPAPGTLERSRLQEWLSYIGTEIHKGFGALFNPVATDEFKEATKEKLGRRFTLMDEQLANREFLLGDGFSVADCYGYTVATWTDFMKIDRSDWPNIEDYMSRIAARPKVTEARKAEGLIN